MATVLLEPSAIFEQRSITIAPSWHCDGTCSHCYIPSTELARDEYQPDVMRAVLFQLPAAIRVVGITGGEPFLHLDRLLHLISAIVKTGRLATVITSARWTIDWRKARETLERLADRGLCGLCVSVDDYHLPRVPITAVVRILRLARRLGVATHVRGVGANARKQVAVLRSSGVLSGQPRRQLVFNLARTGRAADLPEDRTCTGDLGDCLQAMNPLVVPDGRVFACCSVLVLEVRNRALFLGNVVEESIKTILGRASRNRVLAAVACMGPGGLLKLMGRSRPRRYGSKCALCISLLNEPDFFRTLSRKIATDKELRKELIARHVMLDKWYRVAPTPEFGDF